MKILLIIPFIFIAIILLLIHFVSPYKFTNKAGESTIHFMKITSPSFKNNEAIPSIYTCDGKNINPPLNFYNIPETAKSLALIIDDPDAPSGTWVHWLVIDIDPATKIIAENSVPKNSIQATTSFGKPGYGGPCPPVGVHRYFFKLYAIDKSLNLANNAKQQDIEAAMYNHIVGYAELVGLYQRK